MKCNHKYCQNEVKGSIINGEQKLPRKDKIYCSRNCKNKNRLINKYHKNKNTLLENNI
jgi:hypothetical protein